jgi:hypothetical protein
MQRLKLSETKELLEPEKEPRIKYRNLSLEFPTNLELSFQVAIKLQTSNENDRQEAHHQNFI